MKPYYNFPPGQRHVQRLVDQFNTAEELWRSLEAKHGPRRRIRPKLSAKWRELLDLLDYVIVRSPQDCVGGLEEKW